jgi:hypothetical protein
VSTSKTSLAIFETDFEFSWSDDVPS